MRVLKLRTEQGDAAMRALAGKYLPPTARITILREPTTVLRPDGRLSCVYLPGAIPAALCDEAYVALHRLRNHVTDNRGHYSGGERKNHTRQDGTASAQNKTHTPEGALLRVRSSVVGYFDRYPRIPFCRETAFTAQDTAGWESILPMVRAAAAAMERGAPQRHAVQMAAMEQVHPDFRITGTPFTTLTVNNNVQAAVHCDKGDFADGVGVISVVRRGSYSGNALVMARNGYGAELEHGDVFLFDSRDWHVNTPMVDASPDAERISIVYYMRHRMQACGSAAEERQRAAEYGTELQHRKLRGELGNT